MGGVGDFGGVVVACFGSQGGYQHKRILNVVVNDVAVHFDAVDAVIDKGVTGVSEQFDGMEIVENHDRFEDIQFEVALGAGKTDGGVIAHDLNSDHGDGFALGGINLAGHDARAGFVFREGEFTQAAARAGSEPANVVGDLHERSGQGLESAAREHDFV